MPETIASNPNELLNEQQAAELLGVAPKTLAMWRSYRRPGPRFIRVGRLIKYRRRDLDAWLESRTEGTGEVADAQPVSA